MYKQDRFDGFIIQVDDDRDALLTDFSKVTLEERYCRDGERPQDVFARVACAYADDPDHAQRLYDYMSRQWFTPATPVLSNGGTRKALPISCYLNAVPDDLDGIVDTWNENTALGSLGGGIGTYWGGVRSVGEKVKGAGQTSGIIPFIHVMDSLVLAISQGSLRRGAGAVYIDVHHPEIGEFLEIRKASGDFNRKALNLHHGIGITDEFMRAVRDGTPFNLLSPKDGSVMDTVDARELWQKILETRLQTGEPYLLFLGEANRLMADHQRELGMEVRQSNLCIEIMLHTGPDHLGNDRTAVCCLSSVNAATWYEWEKDPRFVEDVMRFLDNVLQDFIDRAPKDKMPKAIYSAMRERSVGLGLMGFHTFLQQNNLPFGSAMARVWNMKFFRHLRKQADAASVKLAEERGACPDWLDARNKVEAEVGFDVQAVLRRIGKPQRFSHKLAVAPTASISIITGGVSAGIEPIPANIYTHKTLSGTFTVKNPDLEKVLRYWARELVDPEDADRWVQAQWDSILEHDGSVQHLDFLPEAEREVFLTAFEIDQRHVIDLAADRTNDVCQSSSVNIFLPGDVDKWDLHMLHMRAWEKGLKSLYYLRSRSVQRAAFAGSDAEVDHGLQVKAPTDYEECLVCQ